MTSRMNCIVRGEPTHALLFQSLMPIDSGMELPKYHATGRSSSRHPSHGYAAIAAVRCAGMSISGTMSMPLCAA